MKYTIDLKKLERQVANLDIIAKKKKWTFSYDEELDTFYFSPKKIASGFSLFSLSDEFSVYVDKNSNFGGIFIEYYKSNMTTHDKKFKPFKNIFTEKSDNLSTISEKLGEKATLLSEVLKAELLSGLVNVDSKNIIIPA
jgi:hypothetical protein